MASLLDLARHGFQIYPMGPYYQAFAEGGSIKLYADGALGSRGAALLDPYADDPKNNGLLKSTPEHLRDVSTRALQHGFQVATHATGEHTSQSPQGVPGSFLSPKCSTSCSIRHALLLA